MNNQFLHMQKLAGLITESEYKVKLDEAENIASKIDQNLDKVEALPAVQQAAEKIMNDPELLKQFQQGLAKMGVNMNLMEEGEGEDVSSADISKIVSAVQSKVGQIKEDVFDVGPDKDIDDRAGAVLRGFFGAPVLVGVLSKVTGAGLYTALGLTALGTTPALLVTAVAGAIIGGVVGAIAHKKRQAGKKLNENSLRNKIKELVHSSLGEAKKKKKDKPEDVAPQDDSVELDMSMDTEEPTADAGMEMPSDTMSPEVSNDIDIDPKVKAIQDSLSKALANAKALGDEKLVNQIGNTITMLVRTQVVGQQAVAESLEEMLGEDEMMEVTRGSNGALIKHLQSPSRDLKYAVTTLENELSGVNVDMEAIAYCVIDIIDAAKKEERDEISDY